MEYYKKVITNYAVFDGRAGRREYWMFMLINALIMIAFSIVLKILGSAFAKEIVALYSFVVLVPQLAVTVRRLHDIDKSAWWLFILLLPIIGSLILIFFTVLKGTEGENRFGPVPLN